MELLGDIVNILFDSQLYKMSKSSKGGGGFSSAGKKLGKKKAVAKVAVSRSEEEQKAHALILQGRLCDAEMIYRNLVSVGSASHIVYTNLGVVLKTKGDCWVLLIVLKKPYISILVTQMSTIGSCSPGTGRFNQGDCLLPYRFES